MATPVNIIPTPGSDGLPYALSTPLTAQEADLAGGTSGLEVAVSSPVQIDASQAILAVVTLTATGYIIAQNCYVVMQVDMGDGVWVDVCWCVWTGNQGSTVFVMSNGIAGADVFQQTRAVGQFPNPQSNGYNQMVLGGRIRFVGKAVSTGGSSALAGTPAQVTATIRYRLLKLR